MRATYTEDFKQAALLKLMNRGTRTFAEVAEELGITPSIAYGWIKKSGKVSGGMPQDEKSSRAWTAQEKFQAVLEFENMKDQPGKQGEFLRRAGLHAALLEIWRKEIMGVLEKPARRSRRTPEEQAKDLQITELKRELLRKDRALAETAALLVLKKKAESIWGLVDDEEDA